MVAIKIAGFEDMAAGLAKPQVSSQLIQERSLAHEAGLV